jgi:hypothetical protein
MSRPAVNPGVVDWSGENPGITLKSSPDGENTCLVSFFRVVVSPHGPGHAVFILTEPNSVGAAGAVNACYTDNEPLARYLMSDFLNYFGAWKGNPNLANLPFLPADNWTHSGDSATAWTEHVKGPNCDLTFTWGDTDPAFMVEYASKEQSATGKHEMFSLFVPAKTAKVVANGVVGKGVPGTRVMGGKTISTCFLAFSETWVK